MYMHSEIALVFTAIIKTPMGIQFCVGEIILLLGII